MRGGTAAGPAASQLTVLRVCRGSLLLQMSSCGHEWARSSADTLLSADLRRNTMVTVLGRCRRYVRAHRVGVCTSNTPPSTVDDGRDLFELWIPLHELCVGEDRATVWHTRRDTRTIRHQHLCSNRCVNGDNSSKACECLRYSFVPAGDSQGKGCIAISTLQIDIDFRTEEQFNVLLRPCTGSRSSKRFDPIPEEHASSPLSTAHIRGLQPSRSTAVASAFFLSNIATSSLFFERTACRGRVAKHFDPVQLLPRVMACFCRIRASD